MVDKSCYPQLNDPEVIGSFFDPFIKFDMIGEKTLYFLELGHQASKLAIKSHKIRALDIL